jgi:hypothetical protein
VWCLGSRSRWFHWPFPMCEFGGTGTGETRSLGGSDSVRVVSNNSGKSVFISWLPNYCLIYL